jgi:hypothetical protein
MPAEIRPVMGSPHGGRCHSRVNLACGVIVQERSLYDPLVRHLRFTAGIDAWWIEPSTVSRPAERIASPHNLAQGEGAHDISS